MHFFEKFKKKLFFNTISRDRKNKKHDEHKINDAIEQYWNHVEQNVDNHIDQFIINKKFQPNNYQETDLVKLVNRIIEQNLEKIFRNNDTRKETDGQNIKLNVLFLTIFGYASSLNIADSIILFTILFIMALYICYSWYNDIKTCFLQNIAFFAIIRELQRKYLPFKPHGDADLKLIQKIKGGHQHNPGMLSSMMKARFFGFLYCLIYIFYLLNSHFL